MIGVGRALVDVGRPHVERHRGDLEADARHDQDDGQHEQRIVGSRLAKIVAIARRLVVPESPYISDMPYSRMPSEKAPSRKYLTAASFDRGFGLMKPARM